MLSMIIKTGVIYTSVHLYRIITYTDGMAAYMCPCILLVICAVTAVWEYIWIHQVMDKH